MVIAGKNIRGNTDPQPKKATRTGILLIPLQAIKVGSPCEESLRILFIVQLTQRSGFSKSKRWPDAWNHGG